MKYKIVSDEDELEEHDDHGSDYYPERRINIATNSKFHDEAEDDYQLHHKKSDHSITLSDREDIENHTQEGNMNLDEPRLSPIVKVDEGDSTEKVSDSSPDKPKSAISNMKYIDNQKIKKVKNKKAALKNIENVDLNVVFGKSHTKFVNIVQMEYFDRNKENFNTVSTKSKGGTVETKYKYKSNRSKSKTTAKTITSCEKHSSMANSDYLKIFSTNSGKKILSPETMNALKKVTKQFDKQSKKTKSKRKKSNLGNIEDLIPKFKNLRKRSKSPVFANIQALNKKLGSHRRMLDNLRKRRRSVETGKTTIKGVKHSPNKFLGKFRKRSPWNPTPSFKNKSLKFKNKRTKAKSPSGMIVPPVIECKNPNKTKDKSVVILLRLNIS